MKHYPLNTMQRNALCQWFGHKDFTPAEVAGIGHETISQMPKIGSKGIEVIRRWLQQYGYDLHPPPVDQKPPTSQRLNERLQNAARLLEKHGYRVEPPGA